MFIPQTAIHRLENPYDEALVVTRYRPVPTLVRMMSSAMQIFMPVVDVVTNQQMSSSDGTIEKNLA